MRAETWPVTPVLMCAIAYAVAAVPMQDYLILGGVSHSQLATLGLVIGLLVHWRLHSWHQWRTDDTALMRLVVVAALTLSAAFTLYDWRESVAEMRRWGVALFVGFLVYAVPRSWREVRLLVWVLLLAPFGAALFAVYQSVLGIGPAAFGIPGTPFTRSFGTIGQPNSFAGYLNGAWPLLLAVTIWAWQSAWRWRWLMVLMLGVTWCALVLSFSRGGWLGATAGLLVMAWLIGGWWRRGVVIVVAGAVIIVAGGWQLIPAPLGPRLGSASQIVTAPDIPRDEAQQRPDVYAAVERAAQFKAGWLMWQKAPLTGIGVGNYSNAYVDVAYNTWWISRGHAHNAYMQIAAEQGVIGLLAYLGLWFVQWRRTVNAIQHTGLVRWLAIGACGSLVAVAAHECFEYLQVHYLPVHVAAVVALAGVAPHVVSSEGERL
ncbi:MAG: hypothetical protein FJ040_07350 [Chloroflexi bacterium]|nr:hypothetical protein [Chloroflexota bacterium]